MMEEEDDISCCICLEEFQIVEDDIDTKPHRLPCSHVFHKSCALPWLTKGTSCPTCRENFTIKDLRYDPTLTKLLMRIKSSPSSNGTTTSSSSKPTPPTTPVLVKKKDVEPDLCGLLNKTSLDNNTSTTTTNNNGTVQQQVITSNGMVVTITGTNNVAPNNNNTFNNNIQPKPLLQPNHNQPLNNNNNNVNRNNNNSIGNINQSIMRELNTARETINKLNNSVSQALNQQPSPLVVQPPVHQHPNKHQHTLTKVNPLTVYKSVDGTPNWLCDVCAKGFGFSEQYHCMTCGNFDMCRNCCLTSGTVTSPSITKLEPHNLPTIHPHPLYCMSPMDYYGHNESRCDKCMSTTRGFAYHCLECGHYDLCSKCYNKEPVVKTNNNSSPTTSLFSSFFSKKSTSPASSSPVMSHTSSSTQPLPHTINIPVHQQMLTKVSSPFEVYDFNEWGCDVCHRKFKETEITFYHSPANFDVCLDCYNSKFRK